MSEQKAELPRYYMGMLVKQIKPMRLRPRWYDLPRWLGLRRWKRQYMLPKGECYLDNVNKILYLREDDLDAMKDEIDRENRSIGAQAMGLDTIRNVQ